MSVSVIIPARNEVYLQKTIDNILENAEGEIEVIAVCDGYWPDPPIKDHPFVNIIHHSEARGQRPSINEAARMAKGNIIGKLDAHCAVGPGFNKIIERDIEYDMTMIPEMYNLDIETWKPKYIDDYKMAVMQGKVNPYMYMGMVDGHLRAQYYSSRRDRQKFYDKKDIKIDETMCCMGPGFFIHKDRFWEQGGCDETHGHWGQQGVEVACKAWLSGGRMVVNKNTWFAHWFRGSVIQPNGKKGWPYPMSNSIVNKSRKYSTDLWMNNKWDKQQRTFQWLLKKFRPPGWGAAIEYPTEESRLSIFAPFYRHIHNRQHDSSWKGIQVLKLPTDMILYSDVFYEKRPELIVEIGTKFGGSALYYRDILDSFGLNKTEIVTLDIKDQVKNKDPRITYLIGSSKDSKIIKKIKAIAKGKKTMLIIDGDHERVTVKWDLHNYNGIVTQGQYMVVEDCYIDTGLYKPGEARYWFLKRHPEWEKTDRCKKYLVGMTMGGWLLKK